MPLLHLYLMRHIWLVRETSMAMQLFLTGVVLGALPFLLLWLQERGRVQHLEGLIMAHQVGERRSKKRHIGSNEVSDDE